MALPEPTQVWETDYSASRRKHRHRCIVCNRITRDGERVVMLRVRRGTKVVHVDPCADLQHSPGTTWREAFRLWGVKRNADLGFREAKRLVAEHPFFRAA